MSRQRSMLPRSVVALCLAVVAVLATGPLASGAPANVRVNPAGSTTQAPTDADPAMSYVIRAGTSPGLSNLVAWEGAPTTSPDGSAIHVARSTNGGASWTNLGTIPQGLENFLGDPQIAWDPTTERVYVVMESCFPPAHKCPPNVVSSTDFGDTWSTPNDIWKSIQTDDKEFATNPYIAVDGNAANPYHSRVYVSWTDFLIQAPSSRLVVQSSDDGGVTWTAPVQVSDPTYSYAENSRIEVGPDGDLYAEFLAYDASAKQYRVVVDRSSDGGATWGPDRVAVNSLVSTGVVKSCGSAGNKAVLNGDIDSFPFPDFAVSPTNENLYITYQAPGPGTNLPDVYFTRSTDGGATWSKPFIVGASPRDQFRPAVRVGPNGQVALAWYDRRNDPKNLKTDVYAAFSTNNGASFGPLERVTSKSFGVPKLNPNYDKSRRNCDSPGRIDIAFVGLANPTDAPLGSGAFVVWGDNRDAGPAGNNGVDPNIYSAHVPIPTTTSAGVTKAGTTVNVAGAVAPAVPGGKVTATLYRKVSGKFVKVTSKAGTLNASSKYALSFTRTAAGSCQVIVKFAGNAAYLTSSVTKPFTC